MRFQATAGFCGCTSLAVGVQVVCFFTLVRSLVTLGLVSSTETFHLLGLDWSPGFQVICGSWAILGVLLAIRSGVGGLYKLEGPLRDFFYYLFLTAASDLWWGGYILFHGSICESLVPEETRRMGLHIICSITESFVIFWCVVFFVVNLYFMFIVWSAAEESKRGMQAAPELLEYIDKLYDELHDAKEKGAVAGAAKGANQYGSTQGQQAPQMKPSVAEYGSWHMGEAGDAAEVKSGFVSKPIMQQGDDPDAPGHRPLVRRKLEEVLRDPILFECPPNRNLHRLREQGRYVVKNVAQVMNDHPNVAFKIEVTAGGGHADSKELREKEMRLAEARADEVKNELTLSNGVKNNLQALGLGYGGGFHGRVFITPL